MQMQGGQQLPVTDVKIVTQKDRRPTGYFILEKTIYGHDAQLFDSTWRHKGKRYLCFTRQATDRVIEDLRVIGEDDAVPPGFSAIAKAHDDDDKALRKHFLCVKIKSRQAAANAVVEIVLINRSKGEQAPPGFLIIANDVNDLCICFKTAPLTTQQVPPNVGESYMYSSAPQPVQPNLQQWNNQSSAPGHPGTSWQQPGYHPAPFQTSYAPHRSTIPGKPAPSSAIEGLPFQVNPKFEVMWKKSEPSVPNVKALTLDDINSKYSYDFSKEHAVTSG